MSLSCLDGVSPDSLSSMVAPRELDLLPGDQGTLGALQERLCQEGMKEEGGGRQTEGRGRINLSVPSVSDARGCFSPLALIDRRSLNEYSQFIEMFSGIYKC